MHNPTPVLENETYKVLWDIEIQTDHLISSRWPELVIIKKEKKKKVKEKKRELAKFVDFAVLADHRVHLKKVK